jgi:O-antigen/teichoic acid export membrane protein
VNAGRLLRLGAVVVAAQLAVAVVGIVALRVYTNLVSPSVFGATNLVLSALGLGMQLFVAGFTAAQLRFYSEAAARGAGDNFTRETMAWALRSTAVLVALALVTVAALRLAGGFALSAAAAAAGAAWLFAMATRNVLMSRIQAQQRQGRYAALQVVEAVVSFAVTCAALAVLPSIAAFLMGQALAIALFLGFLLLTLPDARTAFGPLPATGRHFGAKAWAYGAPFAPLSFLSWLANLGDRYTLAILLGSDAAGRYVAPFSIASRGMLLSNSALCDLFRPILFDAENRRDSRRARSAFRGWLLCSAGLSSAGIAVVYCGGFFMARWLLAPGYRAGAVAIMLWVAAGYAVSGVTQVVESRLLSLGHSGRLLLPMILGALANVAFSVILIRANGIIGAAQATFASFVFQNLATAGFLVHALRQQGGARPQEIKIEPA